MQTAKLAKSFGFLPGGREVFCYVIENRNGMRLEIMNYGATITSLKIQSKKEMVDVVLGFDDVQSYVDSFDLPSAPYLGAAVGRFAGRLNHAKFALENQQIQLTQNHGSHQLHGGHHGFSQQFWEVVSITDGENPSIALTYTSIANEENFPGEVAAQVKYTLTESNEVRVAFRATTSEDTIINLTQHSYFNLDGHQSDIKNQQLYVNAKQILEVDDQNIPTGNFTPLDNHSFDFRTEKPCPQSIDNTFVLDRGLLKATLFNPKNNLKLSVFTNQPAIHIYVGGNCFGQIKGKQQSDYHQLSGICFEAQNFPDAPNHRHFPSALLKKGETYLHNTTFQFEQL